MPNPKGNTEMVRVNTRISSALNNWLDEISFRDGIPKSTLVMLALEQFKQQNQAIGAMSDVIKRLESIEKAVKQNSESWPMEM